MFIFALVIMLLRLVMGIGLMTVQSTKYRAAVQATAASQALALAESGLEDIRVKLNFDHRFLPRAGEGQSTFTYAEDIKEKMSKIPMLDSLKGHIELTMTHEGLRIELLEDSTANFFESGRATLSDRGQVLVSLIGQALARDSNQVMVEGHTDARPYNGAKGYTNCELSADRANSAGN